MIEVQDTGGLDSMEFGAWYGTVFLGIVISRCMYTKKGT